MPVEPGKIEPVTTPTEAHENLDFVKERLSRDRLRLLEVQKFLIKENMTAAEREVVTAIDYLLMAHRRINDAQGIVLQQKGA